jgi:hypothetical protein
VLPVEGHIEMGRHIVIALYLLAMVAIVVGVDFAFLKNRFWERLIVNIAIVTTFAAVYFGFLKRS